MKGYIDFLTELSGGHADEDNFMAKMADPKQLEIGIEVEMEHTNSKEISKQITLDHLSRVKNYYTRLIKAGLVDEKPALDLYKKYYGE